MKINEFQNECISFAQSVIAEARRKPFAVGDSEWSLDEFVTHLVMVNLMCTKSLAGLGPETLPPAEEAVGNDAHGALAQTTQGFLEAFLGAPDKSISCPTPVGAFPAFVVQTQGSMEHLVHACDLANAIGSVLMPSDAVVADALSRILRDTTLYDTFRSMGMYQPAAELSPDASALDRMLAYLGRN
jgi:uncharacterized protein (TIGR03086 family)